MTVIAAAMPRHCRVCGLQCRHCRSCNATALQLQCPAMPKDACNDSCNACTPGSSLPGAGSGPGSRRGEGVCKILTISGGCVAGGGVASFVRVPVTYIRSASRAGSDP